MSQIFYHAAGGAAQVLNVNTGANVQLNSTTINVAHSFVRLQAQGDAIYVTYDGTTPSATNGEVLYPGTPGYFFRRDALAMKFLSSGTSRIFAQPCDLISGDIAASI